jgi:hypothetical protein
MHEGHKINTYSRCHVCILDCCLLHTQTYGMDFDENFNWRIYIKDLQADFIFVCFPSV